jgi:hypothetical protein
MHSSSSAPSLAGLALKDRLLKTSGTGLSKINLAECLGPRGKSSQVQQLEDPSELNEILSQDLQNMV